MPIINGKTKEQNIKKMNNTVKIYIICEGSINYIAYKSKKDAEKHMKINGMYNGRIDIIELK